MQPSLLCNICRKPYSKQSNLTAHINRVHYGVKRPRVATRWKCELCNKSLSSKRAYLEHKNVHNNARPYQCLVCDYSASSEMTLRRHMQRLHLHTSEWSYRCAYCGDDARFVESTAYQLHVKNRHAGLSGTFGCRLCNFETLSSRLFEEHYKRHVLGEILDNRGRPQLYQNGRSLHEFLVDDFLGCGYVKQTLRNNDSSFKHTNAALYIDEDSSTFVPNVARVNGAIVVRAQPTTNVIGGSRLLLIGAEHETKQSETVEPSICDLSLKSNVSTGDSAIALCVDVVCENTDDDDDDDDDDAVSDVSDYEESDSDISMAEDELLSSVLVPPVATQLSMAVAAGFEEPELD